MSTTRELRTIFAAILSSAVAGGTVAVAIGACSSNSATDPPKTCGVASSPEASPGSCGVWFVTLSDDPVACGFPDSGSGYNYPSDPRICAQLCGQPGLTTCALTRDYQVQCGWGCATDGRRYDGLVATRAPAVDGLGGYFARMAFFEAASVDAFTSLEAELRAHAAPEHLQTRARAAARDEVRHASLAAAVARRCGVDVVAPPQSVARPVRSLEAIARENAVEGCVREAFGALVAGAQAKACVPELQPLFRTIHRDETRHAALALDVDRWLSTRLTSDAKARVDAARADALATLRAELDAQPMAVLVDRAGHPDKSATVALYDAFVASVHPTFARAA